MRKFTFAEAFFAEIFQLSNFELFVCILWDIHLKWGMSLMGEIFKCCSRHSMKLKCTKAVIKFL